ncbi:MAG: hypothetical protein LBC37_04810 [Zoogloeaceae bacterium]|jgi:hypothetical protein|nr:hypothetical protein [Zoogloeaceae bacterium]
MNLLLSFFLLLFSALAWAGQTVDIDHPVAHDVFGNGNPPDGRAPGDDPARLMHFSPEHSNPDKPAHDFRDNVVHIRRGAQVKGRVYGAYGNGAGSSLSSLNPIPNAVRNTVRITEGGSVRGDVYGGFAAGAAASLELNVNASSNTVLIEGAAVGGRVYGGYARVHPSAQGDLAAATGNTVTLSGKAVFDAEKSELYGGKTENAAERDAEAFGGNTLNVWNYTGSAVASLQNFERLDFILPAALPPGGVVLRVAGNAHLNDRTAQARPSRITGIHLPDEAARLAPGYSVILIQTGGVLDGANFNQSRAYGKHGTIFYEWELSVTMNQLIATLIALHREDPDTPAFDFSS